MEILRLWLPCHCRLMEGMRVKGGVSISRVFGNCGFYPGDHISVLGGDFMFSLISSVCIMDNNWSSKWCMCLKSTERTSLALFTDSTLQGLTELFSSKAWCSLPAETRSLLLPTWCFRVPFLDVVFMDSMGLGNEEGECHCMRRACFSRSSSCPLSGVTNSQPGGKA